MIMGWFYLIPTIICLVIAYFIYDAVKKTKTKMEKKLGPAPSELAMRQMLEEIKKRDLPKCPRCNCEAFAILETDSKYKCESCQYEFEVVLHI
ncbi:MAG: hypothetical protein ACREBV_04310 [Candidatus Zixiibacteriota bacterium]